MQSSTDECGDDLGPTCKIKGPVQDNGDKGDELFQQMCRLCGVVFQ